MPNIGEWSNTGDDEAHAARRVPPRTSAERRMQRLVALANLMDSSISIPGTQFRIGLDPIIGLIPGVGDAVSAAIGLYIVREAWKLGVGKKQLAAMLGNVLIDMLLGAVPVAGDIADFAFKANQRNLKIMGIEPRGVKIEIDPTAPFRA